MQRDEEQWDLRLSRMVTAGRAGSNDRRSGEGCKAPRARAELVDGRLEDLAHGEHLVDPSDHLSAECE
jgi:hypothetical protein